MIFKTSLDNLAKGITIAVTALFAAIIIGQYFFIKDTDQAISIFISIGLVVIYFIVFALRPVDYEISAGKLIINRLFESVRIDLSQIRSVELLDERKLSGSIRTFAVGGLFGYFGKFTNSKLGSMTWYATRRNKTVLVQTINGKKIILTPDDPAKFVASFIL